MNLKNGNFIFMGKVYLEECPKCKKKNRILSISKGICSWCGLNGYEYYSEELKNEFKSKE